MMLYSDVSHFPLLPSPGGTDVCKKQGMYDAQVQELQESVGIKMYFMYKVTQSAASSRVNDKL